MRLRFDIAYDGTDFHGWAAQPQLRTVQGELEHWLSRILRMQAQLTVAGRTDAGVHASGQVAHLDVDDSVNPEDLHRRLNRVLPEDLVITALTQVPDAFDARFSAIWRRYRFLLCDGPWDPMNRSKTVKVQHLDVEAMGQAGEKLLGLNDFTAFCKAREGATAIRTLQSLTVARVNGLIEIEVQADAFCHSMVRSLVGALVRVGKGERPIDWPQSLLDAPERSSQIPVMPAKGLTLIAVGYPPDEQLAERAEQARNRRTKDCC
ncbi:MAG: tRNA pseudouridine(38-40) synthase TruA [Propionibacteriaceae bacterium]|nr:tRNA pseudouridine(38-40) synthase TruA [Propionibacteriaceae bacterium]